MKDEYSENYKNLIKEIEMTQINSVICHDHGLKKYCYNDHTILSNVQIQCNPYQNSNDSFKGTRIAKATLRKEKKKQEVQCSLISNYST